MLLNINDSTEMYSEYSQKSKMKPFFSFQKLAQVFGNCIKFPKERIKISVAIQMWKIENHCKTPQIVDATDSSRHTRKRGLRTLNRTLSPRNLKKTLSLSTLKSTQSLRNLKGPNQRLTLHVGSSGSYRAV